MYKSNILRSVLGKLDIIEVKALNVSEVLEPALVLTYEPLHLGIPRKTICQEPCPLETYYSQQHANLPKGKQ